MTLCYCPVRVRTSRDMHVFSMCTLCTCMHVTHDVRIVQGCTYLNKYYNYNHEAMVRG